MGVVSPRREALAAVYGIEMVDEYIVRLFCVSSETCETVSAVEPPRDIPSDA